MAAPIKFVPIRGAILRIMRRAANGSTTPGGLSDLLAAAVVNGELVSGIWRKQFRALAKAFG